MDILDELTEYGINKNNRISMRNTNRRVFSRLQRAKENAQDVMRASQISARAMSKIGITARLGGASLSGAMRLAGPIAAVGTAMEVGNYFVQASFDKSIMRNNIKSGLDLLVAETPTIAEFAAFGVAEKAISGKFGGGRARGFIGKMMGKGGGLRGRAISMVGGIVAAGMTSTLLKPLQESLGGYVKEQRSFGAESEMVEKDLNKMKLSQMKKATRQLSDPIFEGGAWNALFNNKLIKWSESDTAEKKKSMMRQELRDRAERINTFISRNDTAIIDYFTRE